MLIDSATIIIRSGKGGDGHVSFRREKYIPKGGPTGGDGGRGGSVILRATSDISTLLDFAGKHHWFAQNGEPGGQKQKHGCDAPDLIINVPLGTLVYDNDTNELIVDLNQQDMRVTLAAGGRGGFGNEHFKSPTNQTPRTASPGRPGEEKHLRLELKVLADVGLVGLPNAGKSTLLAAISKARPKIADYPFTTLEPNLGIVELPGGVAEMPRRLVIADIPGLIEGAHQGSGIGTRFLRHIERTRVLVHLIDIDPADGSDPVNNYHVIRRELEAYSPILAAKPQIVVVSKLDLLADDEDRKVAAQLLEQAVGQSVLGISSATGQGLDALLQACWKTVGQDTAPPRDGWVASSHARDENSHEPG